MKKMLTPTESGIIKQDFLDKLEDRVRDGWQPHRSVNHARKVVPRMKDMLDVRKAEV